MEYMEPGYCLEISKFTDKLFQKFRGFGRYTTSYISSSIKGVMHINLQNPENF